MTRNRPDSLRRCLASLRSQSVQPFEVVISDDSDWQIAPEIRELAQRWACRYSPGPRRGLYANRNRVALACQGTHIRTVDDDHTFPPGHFAQCWEALRSDPLSIWTTGETSFIDGKRHAVAPTANQLHPSGLGSPVADLDNNWSIADGSTIYPGHVFESGYRMIEDYPFGSSYLEFGALLYYRGYRSRCLRGALVEHHATIETSGVRGTRRWRPAICSPVFPTTCSSSPIGSEPGAMPWPASATPIYPCSTRCPVSSRKRARDGEFASRPLVDRPLLALSLRLTFQ